MTGLQIIENFKVHTRYQEKKYRQRMIAENIRGSMVSADIPPPRETIVTHAYTLMLVLTLDIGATWKNFLIVLSVPKAFVPNFLSHS